MFVRRFYFAPVTRSKFRDDSAFVNSPVECGMLKTAERSEKVRNNLLMSDTCMHLRYGEPLLSCADYSTGSIKWADPTKKIVDGVKAEEVSGGLAGDRKVARDSRETRLLICHQQNAPSAARQSKRITWHRTQTKPCRRRAEWIKRLMLLLKLMFHVRKASEGKFSRLTMMFFRSLYRDDKSIIPRH